MSKQIQVTRWARGFASPAQWVAAGATLGMLAAAPARAADPPVDPAGTENPNASLDLARSVAVTGREAFNAGDYETALALFRRAYTLYPAPTVVLYEARTLEKMGLLLEALEAYQRTTALSVSEDAPGQFAEAVAAARQEERALRGRVPTLTLRVDGVSANDPNLKVSINGRAIGAAQLGQAQSLNPGTYRITGSIGSDRSDTAEVVLAASQRAAVTLKLGAPSLSPPAPVIRSVDPVSGGDSASVSSASSGDSLRLAAFISGGVGLAGIGTGIVTGLMSVSSHTKAEQDCPAHICPEDGSATDTLHQFRSLRTVSTAFYGVGAAGLAAGVVFWLIAPSSPDASQAGTLHPWLEGRNIGLKGAF